MHVAEGGAAMDACTTFADLGAGAAVDGGLLCGKNSACLRVIHARIDCGTGFPCALSTVSGIGVASANMQVDPYLCARATLFITSFTF